MTLHNITAKDKRIKSYLDPNCRVYFHHMHSLNTSANDSENVVALEVKNRALA